MQIVNWLHALFHKVSPACFGVLHIILKENFLRKVCCKVHNIPFFVDYSTCQDAGTAHNPDKMSTLDRPKHICKNNAHTLTPAVAAHSQHILSCRKYGFEMCLGTKTQNSELYIVLNHRKKHG